MSDNNSTAATSSTSRRDFIRAGLAAGGVAVGLSQTLRAEDEPKAIQPAAVHAFGDGMIKIGLVGAGGRGTGAASDALNTGNVKLVAVADAFEDRVVSAVRGLSGRYGEKIDVPKERQFVGFDGYKGVMASGCDLVILATPPGFRPLHFEAAVKANKHVFMEKPVAVDAPGVRQVLAATKIALANNKAVAVGLQRRHERRYMDCIKQLQDGAIGDIVLGRAYWNGAGVWVRPRQKDQTELEYQMRNWYYFNWLCGDHICEQHIHNLDVINWLKNGYPVEANGMGGREVRRGKDHGQIYDHHFVEFTYADGSKMLSQCRHIPGCWDIVAEFAHGTNGTCDIGGAKIYNAKGERVWSYGQGGGGGHQQEHVDLFADLRAGRIPNEGEYGAMSTMTSILGRLATYSGKVIRMEDALKSDIAAAPFGKYTSMSDEAPVLPDAEGNYPIPVPGQTKVV